MLRAVRLPTPLLFTLALARCSCEDAPAELPFAGEDGGAGNGGVDGGPLLGCLAGLEALTLEPSTRGLLLDGRPVPPVTVAVRGSFADGTTADIDPARLEWSVEREDDAAPGSVSDGVLMVNPAVGGTLIVRAYDGCVRGEVRITLTLSVVIGQPTDPSVWMGPAPTPGGAGAPVIVYPSDGTRFPRNIYRTLFQWRSEAGRSYRLTFSGPGATITVFTDGAHPLCASASPRAGCWEADEAAWNAIASSNAGEEVTWTVDAVGASGPPTRSASIVLGFSKRDVPGAIFYWSTTSAGIRRGNVRAAEPEDYLTGKPRTRYAQPADEVSCVACHVVSRDGRFLAAPLKAQTGEGLWTLEVTPQAPPAPIQKRYDGTRGHGFATFSPDASRLALAWKGKLWTVDRVSGRKIADISLGMLKGTHPDWAPDDRALVFATGEGDAPARASLALLPRMGDGFGAPMILSQQSGDRTHLFPAFSPDSAWIAYSVGKGGHGDDEAQLHLISSSPGAPGGGIELVNANRIVSNQRKDGSYQNSQPTWAPPGDLAWIAFNSKREYGVVLPEGTQQIWVTAIDTEKAARGEDPSYPAFRLQFQGLEENNHRAYWTLDVRDPPPDAGVADGGPSRPDAAEFDGGACAELGASCDPTGPGCCTPGALCDTIDDGMSYRCALGL